MTAKHKKFILKTLIPFILRERGRGFVMSHYRLDATPGEDVCMDGIVRKTPSCGTIACIAGSIHAVLGMGGEAYKQVEEIGAAIGLTLDEADGLFECWAPSNPLPCRWPESFARRYARARTTLEKAQVAAALLREVVKTEGLCLHAGPR